MDAVMAAPEHHGLLFQNEWVRVLDIPIGPGETVAMHTHCWPSVLYLLSWSDFVRRDGAGRVLTDSRAGERPVVGGAVWSPAMPPHTLENVGAAELRLVGVELKRAGVKTRLADVGLGTTSTCSLAEASDVRTGIRWSEKNASLGVRTSTEVTLHRVPSEPDRALDRRLRLLQREQ